MVMRAIDRVPSLDGLDLYRRLDAPDPGTRVSDPGRVEAVVSDLRDRLQAALSSSKTVGGWRAQALFASTVAALDGCLMMTQVDLGEIFVEGDSVKAPDYFLHLRSGDRILVDVKNIAEAPANAESPVKFSASEIDRLRRFGHLYGARVFVALYYAAFPLWSLVSLDDLVRGPGGGYRILFGDALRANNMALIGDRTIGIEPPLQLVLHSDPAKPREIGADGTAPFTVGSVEVFAGGKRVESSTGRRIVWFLMMHGGWAFTDSADVGDSKLLSITWSAEPEEGANTDERFELVGSLSSMYARMFEQRTTGVDGVSGLDISIEPGTLINLIPHDYESKDPALWRFELSPRRKGESGL